MKKNSILFGLAALLLLVLGVPACAPDYETKFDVNTLVVPDDDLAYISFPAAGGSKDIRVNTNVDKANWTATSNADWVTLDKQDGKVAISASPNTLFVSRTARVTIAYGYQTYTINMEQRTGTASEILVEGQKDGTLKELPTAGGTISVKVSSNMVLDYITIPDSTSWIQWVSTEGEGQEKTLTFKVAPSYVETVRGSTITIQSSQNPNYVSSFRVEQDKKVWESPIAVPLTVDMLSANATQNNDGQGLPGLVDGNVATYYHTLWSGAAPGGKLHYVQMNLNEPLQFLRFEYDSRNSGSGDGDVTRVGIWVSETGANDDAAWEKASTVYFPLPRGRGQRTSANVAVLDKPYKYIRFTPEARRNANPINPSGNNGWWNMANLYLFTYSE